MIQKQSNLQSLVSFKNSQGDAARGTLLKLERATAVFEVYNPYSIVQLSEVLQELKIRRGERTIYKGRAVVNNLVNTGLMLIVSTTLVDPWNDLSGVLDSSEGIAEETHRFIDDWRKATKVRPGYQLVVGEMRSFFYELHRWMGQIDISVEESNDGGRSVFNETYFDELLGPIEDQTYELFRRFEEEAAEVSVEEIIPHKAFVQRDLHPLIMRAPFPFRAFYKPLGYAGDYEMINMMLRNPREGPTAYAELINTLYLQTGPAQAHRNRLDILREWLIAESDHEKNQSQPFRVLNIGCGPAVELQEIMSSERISRQCCFGLVDFNQETLNYAKKKFDEITIPKSRNVELEYRHLSVHSLLKSSASKIYADIGGRYDVVYCAGLFDYLSDRVCTRLLKLFFQWVKLDGGKVLATNVHPENSSLHMMEHLLEWFLIYRDEKAMRALLPNVGKQRVFLDSTGINVFLEIERSD